jgi:hypothetical protein
MRTLSQQRGLAELRRGTEWFIADDPYEITLIPHEKVKKPGGVYDYEPQPARATQTFKMIANVLDTFTTGTSEGSLGQNWDYVLLGLWDAEIEINDTWDDGNSHYRVARILQANDYESRAAVVSFGKDPGYG